MLNLSKTVNSIAIFYAHPVTFEGNKLYLYYLDSQTPDTIKSDFVDQVYDGDNWFFLRVKETYEETGRVCVYTKQNYGSRAVIRKYYKNGFLI